MSISSTVSVVPDYNATSQFVNIETYNNDINDINNSISVLDANLITASAQSALALSNSNIALNGLPIINYNNLNSEITLTNTFQTIITNTITTTSPDAVITAWSNINVIDLNVGSGSIVEYKILINSVTPQYSTTFINNIVKNHNQVISIFYNGTGENIAGTIDVSILMRCTTGSAKALYGQLLTQITLTPPITQNEVLTK